MFGGRSDVDSTLSPTVVLGEKYTPHIMVQVTYECREVYDVWNRLFEDVCCSTQAHSRIVGGKLAGHSRNALSGDEYILHLPVWLSLGPFLLHLDFWGLHFFLCPLLFDTEVMA